MTCIDSFLWVKICGLMQPDQTVAIARLGASAIGFICVPASPRYVTPQQIRIMSEALIADGADTVERVGVFANATPSAIAAAITTGKLTTLQLHGQETPQTCLRLRQAYPTLKLIKALRIRSEGDLANVLSYESSVDALLLDAYHPQLLGGTGQTLDWSALTTFQPQRPWILAGGLTPENIRQALSLLSPQGIDISSGVEDSPGHKSLDRVKQLFVALQP